MFLEYFGDLGGGNFDVAFSKRFCLSLLMDFGCPRPPGGKSAAWAQTLWQLGNIAFGLPEGDITMCLCTFCTEASAKP